MRNGVLTLLSDTPVRTNEAQTQQGTRGRRGARVLRAVRVGRAAFFLKVTGVQAQSQTPEHPPATEGAMLILLPRNTSTHHHPTGFRLTLNDPEVNQVTLQL